MPCKVCVFSKLSGCELTCGPDCFVRRFCFGVLGFRRLNVTMGTESMYIYWISSDLNEKGGKG